MPEGGILCEACGHVRAPTLAECPWCRASAPIVAAELPTQPLEEAADLALSNPPVALTLGAIPLFWAAAGLLFFARPVDSYATGEGWLAGVSLVIGAVATFVGVRPVIALSDRRRLFGARIPPVVIAITAFLGALPLAVLCADVTLRHANAPGAIERAECTWTVAHQLRSRRTGDMGHVEVDASCTLADGARFEACVPLEHASAVAGPDIVVPVRRGRLFGIVYGYTEPTPAW